MTLPLFTRQTDDPAAHTPTIYDAHAATVNEMMDELEPIAAASLHARYSSSYILSATLTLTDADLPILSIDCNGANRIVKLPAQAATNHPFFLINETGAGYIITVQDNAGALSFADLADGDALLFVPDGSVGWKIAIQKADGWTPVHETWTYASANTINVPSDATTRFQKWDKIRIKQGGGWKYFHNTGTAAALLTVNGGSDFTVANGAITDIYISRFVSPLGFPVEFNWTPVITNLTVGNGTLTGKFQIRGGLIYHHWELLWGTTTSISGDVTYAPPVTIGVYGLNGQPLGLARLRVSGVTYNGVIQMVGTTSIRVAAIDVSATYSKNALLSSTIPATWANADEIQVNGIYTG